MKTQTLTVGTGRGFLQVALFIETSHSYGRSLLRGIEDYNRRHDQWGICLCGDVRFEPPAAWLKKWKGHGVISRVENERTAAALAESGLPVVAIGPAGLLPGAPCVTADQAGAAELAANHLAERGSRVFVYCGDPRFAWSAGRSAAFSRMAAPHGTVLPPFDPPTSGSDASTDPALIMEWVAGLPKPIGIFACHDARGAQILQACRLLGVRVPDDVAVLGVGNDQVYCELSPPSLTSILTNARRIGWEAARMLAELLAEGKVPAEPLIVPPTGLVVRQSTERAAVQDPHISQALRFIRDHACEGISVARLLQNVPVSRRQLERRFQACTGHTIGEEITRVRMAAVKDLLASTDLPLSEIAFRAGFRHAEYLSVVFKRENGRTPSEYRAQLRGAGGGPAGNA